MYMENNDIRSLRDRAPEGCGCDREGREMREMREMREVRAVHGEHEMRGAYDRREGRTLCPICDRRSGAGAQRDDCTNYFITLGAPLAAVYSPIQVWKDVYGEAQALARGTLFAELDKPFLAKGRKCK